MRAPFRPLQDLIQPNDPWWKPWSEPVSRLGKPDPAPLIPGKTSEQGQKRRILVVMKPVRGATRRLLPGSPFNNMPAHPPVERFDVQDQVTHDSYGLGRVKLVEDDTAVIVAFGSRQVRIMWPYTKLTKL